MSPSGDPWVWLSAILTVAILSYLFKDNPFYKVAEYLFVGVAAGYYLSIQFDNVLIPNLFQPVQNSASAAIGGVHPGIVAHLRAHPGHHDVRPVCPVGLVVVPLAHGGHGGGVLRSGGDRRGPG